jgi:hypothetical protein
MWSLSQREEKYLRVSEQERDRANVAFEED